MSLSTKAIITKFLWPNKFKTVRFINVEKQIGRIECGLYAIAYWISLANGQDPCKVVYDQREMREHLISHFKKTTHAPIVTITICPICKETDTLMAFCENCKQWFHKGCIPLFHKKDDDCNWMCLDCLKNNYKPSQTE